MSEPTIAFIGAGNMASSIIGGLVQEGMAPRQIIASDPAPAALERLQAVAPVQAASDNDSAIAQADVLVLAVKPQVMKEVVAAVAPAVRQRRPLLISIAAGIELHSLQRWLGDDSLPMVRCMPNTPALVRQGATALFASPAVSPQQRQLADRILGAVGLALWVEQEADLDAVTALSGSGPAYFFALIEALQTAGEGLGLSAETARKLTLQTALGATTMAAESDVDAAELRRRVTSPGGTTERALNVLGEGDLHGLFRRALTAARDRSRELARQLDE